MSNYYKENKDEFINSTIDCNMSFQYNLFEKYEEFLNQRAEFDARNENNTTI